MVVNRVRRRVQFMTSGTCRVDRSDGDNANINKIVDRYTKYGILPQTHNREELLGDFSNVTCFADVIEVSQRATDSFNALPSSLRSRFNNSPTEFLRFLEDPANVEEARKLGLLNSSPAEGQKEEPKAGEEK